MEEVTLERLVRAPLARVWETVTDIEAYPSYMENVLSVKVFEQSSGHRTAEWAVSLRGSVLWWVERGELDAASGTVRFEQIDGDLAEFSGSWRLCESGPDLVTATFHVRFDIGVPLLATMLNPIARASLADNAEHMLSRVESRSANLSP